MSEASNNIEVPGKLWTRDFTILMAGSVVSLLGNSLSGFAISLMVLDYTGSPFYFSIFVVSYTLPQIIMPIFSGAVLDRFSRRKTIYTLDFISAAMYFGLSLLLGSGWFNFWLFASLCFFGGLINSIYMVAYQSFFPMLVSAGNYHKAYSISSFLETLTALATPAAAFLYNLIGISRLLGINAVFFLIAAVFETQIKAEEKYIELQKAGMKEGQRYGLQFLADIKEGFRYLVSEKALLFVAIYFTFSSFSMGAEQVIVLPYFKLNYGNGEYLFMLVMAASIIGRSLGSLFHYKRRMPVSKKYIIAYGVYVIIAVAGGIYLYLPFWGMIFTMFVTGGLGITSYTIRISATQAYVPDERKGRFNGAFNMLNTLGALAGEMLAGALSTLIEPRAILALFYGINLAAVFLLIGRNRRYIEPLYNTQK